MTDFFIRVELHGANSEDYEKLHAQMESHGFSQTYAEKNSTRVFQLPTAEYFFSTLSVTVTTQSLVEKVVGIAQKIRKDPDVMVIQAIDFSARLHLVE